MLLKVHAEPTPIEPVVLPEVLLLAVVVVVVVVVPEVCVADVLAVVVDVWVVVELLVVVVLVELLAPEVVELLVELPEVEAPVVLVVLVLLPQATNARAKQIVMRFFIVGNSSKRQWTAGLKAGASSTAPRTEQPALAEILAKVSPRVDSRPSLGGPSFRSRVRSARPRGKTAPEALMGESKSDISSLIDELRKEREILDGRLDEMGKRRHLSVSEEAEMKRIKRMKLVKKDRLVAIQAALQAGQQKRAS